VHTKFQETRRTEMKKVLSSLFVLCLLLASCVLPPPPMAAPVAAPQVEPDAGSWQTWVVTDVTAVRPPAPPDQAATQAELKEVQALMAGRDEAALAQIAYWDAGSPGYRWLEISFTQSKTKQRSPLRNFRQNALLNVAIYDATIAAWDAKYTYNRARPAAMATGLSVLAQHTDNPSYPSEHAVAAGAASTILAYLYPDDAQLFTDLAQAAAHSRVAAGAHFPSDVAAGLELGRQVAQQVIARAEQDGSATAQWDGVIPVGPGLWTGENPAEPAMGQWQTWTLAVSDELRPGPPLAYDSPELAAELQETLGFTRTWQTTQKATYWQTFDGVWEGWYTLASLRMFEQGLEGNPPRAARAYAMMGVAHYDAVVACWDAKYTYWFIRPPKMEPTLTTVIPVPPYPSYPAGHACASTAMSEVFADQFPTYADAIRARATEALESRIWAGIHFRHELVVGKEIGLIVAQRVIERAK
jgi:membrane-associated phospholipid phosphatase